METPKERTKRWLEEARKKAIAHEEASRKNAGKNDWPWQLRLKITLPLVVVAMSLYGMSIMYTRQQANKLLEHRNRQIEAENQLDTFPTEEDKEVLKDSEDW